MARSDRLSWGGETGVLALDKRDPDAAIARVRAWLAEHEPDDLGFKAALRWVTRREILRSQRKRQVPALERLHARVQEQEARKSRPAQSPAEIVVTMLDHDGRPLGAPKPKP